MAFAALAARGVIILATTHMASNRPACTLVIKSKRNVRHFEKLRFEGEEDEDMWGRETYLRDRVAEMMAAVGVLPEALVVEHMNRRLTPVRAWFIHLPERVVCHLIDDDKTFKSSAPTPEEAFKTSWALMTADQGRW